MNFTALKNWKVRGGLLAAVVTAALLVSLFTGLMTTSTKAASSSTFVANGDFGYVVYNDGTNYVYLSVQKGGTANAPETWLNYAIYDISSPYWTILEQGYGLIPNDALRGSGAGHLALNVDTSSVPGFNLYAGSGGPISLEWNKTSGYTAESSGSNSVRYSNGLKYMQRGSYSYSSAEAAGSIIGNAVIAGAQANTGTQRGVTHQVEP